MRKYFEKNENENTAYKKLRDVTNNSAFREIYSITSLY